MRLDAGQMCQVRPPPSFEDEISTAVVTQLRSRAVHFDWVKLWHALFPEDSEVPDSGKQARYSSLRGDKKN